MRRPSPVNLAGSWRSSAAACLLQTTTTQSTASSAPSTIIRCSSGLTGRESPSAVWWRYRCSQRQSDGHPVCEHLPDRRRARRAGCQRTPLVITTFRRVYALPLQQASVPLRSSHQSRYLRAHALHFPARSAKPWRFPALPTTTPAAALAKKQASSSELPAASVARRGRLITVSPAPVTSYTSCAWLAYAAALYPVAAATYPCSERVTNRAEEFVIGNQFHAALNNLFFGLTFTRQQLQIPGDSVSAA